MMDKPVDLSKIKPGDEVTVRATVYEIHHDKTDWALRIEHVGYGAAPQYVDPQAIVSHTPKPRPLEVGDRVTGRSWIGRPRIICIHGEWAWLTDDAGWTMQELLTDLERVNG